MIIVKQCANSLPRRLTIWRCNSQRDGRPSCRIWPQHSVSDRSGRLPSCNEVDTREAHTPSHWLSATPRHNSAAADEIHDIYGLSHACSLSTMKTKALLGKPCHEISLRRVEATSAVSYYSRINYRLTTGCYSITRSILHTAWLMALGWPRHSSDNTKHFLTTLCKTGRQWW